MSNARETCKNISGYQWWIRGVDRNTIIVRSQLPPLTTAYISLNNKGYRLTHKSSQITQVLNMNRRSFDEPQLSEARYIPTTRNEFPVAREVNSRDFNEFLLERIGSTRRSSHLGSRNYKTITENDFPLIIDEIVKPVSYINKDDLSDVTINVEGVKFYLHRMILARASPLFKAMFFGTLSEGQSTIQENNITAEEFNDFLSTFYLEHDIPVCTRLELSQMRAETLVPIYHRYQMTNYFSLCENTLTKSPIYNLSPNDMEIYIDDICRHGELAEKYKMATLKKIVAKALIDTKSGLWLKRDSFRRLTRGFRDQIIERRLIQVDK